MPESDRPMSLDPPPPEAPPNVVPGARGTVRPPVTDDLVAEILAAEAAVRAAAGFVPVEAPGPSPTLPGTVREVFAACEARLLAAGVAGCLSAGDAMWSRGWRGRPSRDLVMYAAGSPHGREGLWIAEGAAGAVHFSAAPTGLLADCAPYLPDLEEMLGVSNVASQLRLAAQEAALRAQRVI